MHENRDFWGVNKQKAKFWRVYTKKKPFVNELLEHEDQDKQHKLSKFIEYYTLLYRHNKLSYVLGVLKFHSNMYAHMHAMIHVS